MRAVRSQKILLSLILSGVAASPSVRIGDRTAVDARGQFFLIDHNDLKVYIFE